jgi:hypothetical protein
MAKGKKKGPQIFYLAVKKIAKPCEPKKKKKKKRASLF